MSERIDRRKFVGRAAVRAAVLAGVQVPSVAKAAADGWGDLTGRFVYDGKPPLRKKLKVDKDLECCGEFDIRDESLMVGPDGGLQNAYIYVRSRKVDVCPELEKEFDAEDKRRVLLENRDCIFIPHCMKIWYTKQEFYTTNTQPIADNVAFEPIGDVAANIVLPAAKESSDKIISATWKFRRKQRLPVPIHCNYHPWEKAHILPLDHPYVDISKADGTFRISKLPAVELEFQVWQEKVGYLYTPKWKKGRFKMTIKPGVNDLGTIKFPASMFEKK